jgi:hypothetical protein
MVNIEWNSYLACAYAEGFCEGEDATIEEQMEAWAYIIKNKLYRNLQGFYGRISSELINNGYISIDGKINWDKVYNSE